MPAYVVQLSEIFTNDAKKRKQEMECTPIEKENYEHQIWSHSQMVDTINSSLKDQEQTGKFELQIETQYFRETIFNAGDDAEFLYVILDGGCIWLLQECQSQTEGTQLILDNEIPPSEELN